MSRGTTGAPEPVPVTEHAEAEATTSEEAMAQQSDEDVQPDESAYTTKHVK